MADGVLRDEAAGLGVVVAVAVVEQSGAVRLPAGERVRVGGGRARDGRLSAGVVGVAGGDRSIRAGEADHRTQRIGEVDLGRAVLGSRQVVVQAGGRDGGRRGTRGVLLDVRVGPVGEVLLRRGAERLAAADAQGVVRELADRSTGGCEAGQLAAGVPFVGALAVGLQLTVGVIGERPAVEGVTRLSWPKTAPVSAAGRATDARVPLSPVWRPRESRV